MGFWAALADAFVGTALTATILGQLIWLELFCYWEEVPTTELTDKIIRYSRERTKDSIIDKLPDIAFDYIILPGGKKVYAGTILTRPLRFRVAGLLHEGVVFGSRISGEEVILEMNDTDERTGLQPPINLARFPYPYGLADIGTRYEPASPIPLETLKHRARFFDYAMYKLSDNCIDFADRVVFDKKSSSIIKAQLSKCDDLMLLYRRILSDTKEEHIKQDYLDRAQKLSLRKEELKKRIEEFV